MKRFISAIIISSLLSTFSLVFGFIWVDYSEFAFLIAGINILLLIGYWFEYLWTSHLMLLINTFFICVGVFASIPTWILVVAIIGVIAYWDLIGFLIRTKDIKNSESLFNIKEKHLLRLSIVLFCAGLISTIPLFIKIQISFIVILIISVSSVVGLGYAVRFTSRSE